jgi:hypothetical protein
MTNQLFVILLIGLVVLVYVGLALANYVRMRGTRVIVCPENHQPAAVKVDASHAAMTAVWESPDIRLQSCSRWPEREGCDQSCTSQISGSPADTLAFEMLKKWYSDKSCAICRRPIPPLQHVGPKPGMLNVASPGHETLSWDEIPAEHLPAMFETHLAVCSSCQVAEAFRRQFPDLVLDRDRRPGSNTSVH